MKGEPQEPAALEKRAQPGRLRAIFLAAAVHLAFFALIVFGVTWQSSPTPPVQAELWDKLPPANDKAKPEPPKPEPPKPEPPKPEPPKREPPKPEPPKPDVKPPAPAPDPAIALKLEREKREKEKKAKAERDKQERAEKQKQEDAAKKKHEQEEAARKKKEDDKRRVEDERAREEAASARQKAIDGFVNQIKAKIRGRANVPDTVSGKPSVQVHIRILPGGEVLDIAVTRGSGNRVYDTAIERAIRSASPLPVPEANSELFPQFRDLILNIEHER